MNRKEVSPAGENPAVRQFIRTFLLPTSGRSPQSIKSRIIRWIEIANNPSQGSSNASAKEIAELRRRARQNVRRLAKAHPQVAAEILATIKPEELR